MSSPKTLMKKVQNTKAESQQILSYPQYISIFKLYNCLKHRGNRDLSLPSLSQQRHPGIKAS